MVQYLGRPNWIRGVTTKKSLFMDWSWVTTLVVDYVEEFWSQVE